MLKLFELEKGSRWLVTGAAGFIGSHLVEELLLRDQEVVGLDDYSTGRIENLDEVRQMVTTEQWGRFRLIEGDIRKLDTCVEACRDVQYVVHLAAMASVPTSMENPALAHAINVGGFLNVLLAARQAEVSKVVFASSSAVYGDYPQVPLEEDRLGNLLSPYAGTKRINELDAQVFAFAYGLQSVGLRFFNVYGPRQSLNGPYAAVIPRWVEALVKAQSPTVYGDGSATRSFCFVKDVVDACLLAATRNLDTPLALFNIGGGSRTSLNQLFEVLQVEAAKFLPLAKKVTPDYQSLRAGDILHSDASIERARLKLGFAPAFRLSEGLEATLRFRLGQGMPASP